MSSSGGTERKGSGTILVYAACSLFFSLTVLFFGPMEVVLLNIRDFHFSFSNVWLFQLAAAAALAAALACVLRLLPRGMGIYPAAALAGAGTAAWVQTMFLNGSMIVLTGEKMEVTSSQKTVNILIWAVIIGLFVLFTHLFRKKNLKLVRTVLQAACCGLTAVQLIAFAVLALSTDTSVNSVSHHLSDEGEFVFGGGQNVIEIILDTADGEYVEEMLEHYPELRESLSGWTYYPNMTSKYSRTYPSITYMLSGAECRYDTEPAEYVNGAFRNSEYLRTISEHGTDIRVFSPDPEMIGEEGIRYVANGKSTGNEIRNLDFVQLEKNLARIGLYKCMPYMLKDLFQYRLEIVNLSSFNFRPFRHYLDPYIYNAIRENGGVTVSPDYGDTFRFYHLWSTHPGAYWDSELKPAEELRDYDVLRGSFRFIEEFIGALKKEGIYDSSLIIVTADHGMSGGDRTALERDRASCPLLMVKDPYSDTGRPMAVSKAPVSHDDLFETILEAYSCRTAEPVGSGKKISDFAEGEDRVRIHYYTALDKRTNEVALLEYAIDGDATDFGNWRKTGKYWDILYSFNAVSDIRYGDRKQ